MTRPYRMPTWAKVGFTGLAMTTAGLWLQWGPGSALIFVGFCFTWVGWSLWSRRGS